jgi:hypothetical protein
MACAPCSRARHRAARRPSVHERPVLRVTPRNYRDWKAATIQPLRCHGAGAARRGRAVQADSREPWFVSAAHDASSSPDTMTFEITVDATLNAGGGAHDAPARRRVGEIPGSRTPSSWGGHNGGLPDAILRARDSRYWCSNVTLYRGRSGQPPRENCLTIVLTYVVCFGDHSDSRAAEIWITDHPVRRRVHLHARRRPLALRQP